MYLLFGGANYQEADISTRIMRRLIDDARITRHHQRPGQLAFGFVAPFTDFSNELAIWAAARDWLWRTGNKSAKRAHDISESLRPNYERAP